ncbi:MAG: cytidylate kinase family protein, partial [Lachnospiraceae bacterium]|nr:cytidylate kinase family protein [Lachnospiraceae bacterium]
MSKVITISREYGAGGHSIGLKLAEQLGIPLYDKEIMDETAKASGFDMELIESEEEDVSMRTST